MSDFPFGVSPERATAQFTDFIHAAGIKPKHSLTVIPDGALHRFSVEGDKGGETSGAYCLHLEGCPAGYVQDWKRGIKETWKYDFDAEERREYGRSQHDTEERAKYEAARREAERAKAQDLKLQEEKQQQARAMALAEWNAGTGNPESYGITSGYLFSRFGASTGIYFPERGQFYVRYAQYQQAGQTYYDYTRIIYYPLKVCTGTITGGICQRGELLVPFIDVTTGAFKTLQRVSATPDSEGKYTKRFYPLLSPKGAAHALIPEHSERLEAVFVVEGIATALAVMIDTGGDFTVFSTGSCGNLAPVCKGLRTRYSKRKIIIVADNDTAGISAAMKCKDAGLADDFKYPPRVGEDFYDFLARKVGNNYERR